MKYGLPYKGSKNKLAERIVSLLPQADHLIDLFCGGCAVTHCALLRRKWPHVHINDIDWRPVTLFRDALAGRYQDETRWISREDFQRLKDTDPYVAVVWSFGNNMRDYLYSQDIEPLKRAIHYAMFYGDYEPARELGHDLSFIQPIDDLQKRYLAVKHYFSRLGHFQQQSFEGGAELDCSPGISREIQLQSWNMGGGRIRLLGASAGQPNCNTWNVATEWGSFKKKKNQSECRATSNDETCYRLQYRERHRSLPVVGGAEMAFTHIVRGRLPRHRDTRRLGHLLRHTLRGHECLRQVRAVRLRGVLRLVLAADAAHLHQQLRHARRPLPLHRGVCPSLHAVGIGQQRSHRAHLHPPASAAAQPTRAALAVGLTAPVLSHSRQPNFVPS